MTTETENVGPEGTRPRSVLVREERPIEGGCDACLKQARAVEPGRMDLLTILPEEPPSTVLEGLPNGAGDALENLRLVVLDDRTRSASRRSAPVDDGPDPVAVPVPDPSDLSQLADVVRASVDEWRGNGNRTVVCGGSLTALSEWVEPTELCGFLRDLLAQLREIHVHFHISPDAHDPAEVDDFTAMFDTVVDSIGQADRRNEERGQTPEFVFEVLANPVRRRLLSVLFEESGGMDLDVLIGRLGPHVPGIERGGTDLSGTGRSRIQIALQHNHLPKLADAGIVAYDYEDRTVTLVGHEDTIEPVLELLE